MIDTELVPLHSIEREGRWYIVRFSSDDYTDEWTQFMSKSQASEIQNILQLSVGEDNWDASWSITPVSNSFLTFEHMYRQFLQNFPPIVDEDD